MPTFTEIAQDRLRTAPLNHRLTIDGEDFTNALIDCSVTYTTDVGGSGMELSLHGGEFEEYEDARLTLDIGYGEKRVPYFVGRLVKARDVEGLGRSAGTAYGPFRIMAEQDIGEDMTYQFRNLEYIAMDLAHRTGHDGGMIEVRNGRNFTLPLGEQFPWDTKALDVLNTVMDKAEFVAADMPGGKRLVMPRPRPGANTGYIATYSPATYTSLSIDNANETTYHSVVVYRNGANGKPIVWAERETGSSAPRNRRFIVSDFPGNNQQAAQKAFDLAENLRAGERSWSMTTFFNPDLLLWSGLRLVRIKRHKGKRTQFVYTATIDSQTVLSYSPGTASFEVSGTCYELKHLRRPLDETPERQAVSSGVVRAGDTNPDNHIEDTFIPIGTDIL